MAVYIGKRVVPIDRGNWDINAEYEMLSIVLDTATKHSCIFRRDLQKNEDQGDVGNLDFLFYRD